MPLGHFREASAVHAVKFTCYIDGTAQSPALVPPGSAVTTIVVLFNLKTGVLDADYERWARSTDLPTVNQLRSVDQFRVLKTSGLLGGGTSPYQYVELIEVNHMDGLFADIGGPLMQKIASEFQAFADTPLFIVSESIA